MNNTTTPAAKTTRRTAWGVTETNRAFFMAACRDCGAEWTFIRTEREQRFDRPTFSFRYVHYFAHDCR